MKHSYLRCIASVLACALLISLLPAHAMAQQDAPDADADVEVYVLDEETDETSEELTGEMIVADFVDDMPDNDELFAGYVQQVFYPELATATYGDYAKRCLSTAEYKIYAALKAEIEKIAAGERESTSIRVRGNFSDVQLDKADFELIYYCLLVDCPYEMYWHNKVLGCNVDVDDKDPNRMTFMFVVDQAYAVQTDDDENQDDTGNDQADAKKYCYKIDTTKTKSTSEAKANADKIVRDCADLSDIKKLEAYKDKICELTDYNDEAATTMASDPTAYGDPWQMIYVFDGDPNTNVVCEGYTKAFQYLCDQSTFAGDVQCYTVTGKMGGGEHMWNIVTLEGKNYLVDVTNSEEDCVGKYGDLFLAEGIGWEAYGYTRYMIRYRTSADAEPTQGVWYVYDADTLTLYDAAVLTLAGTQIRAVQNENEVPRQETSHVNGGAILLVCGVGLISAAAVAYFFYWRQVSLEGVACNTNGEALPYATVCLLRGERILARTKTDANGNYRIAARGADTLEVSYTDPETGEKVTTRQSLKNWLDSWLADRFENETSQKEEIQHEAA